MKRIKHNCLGGFLLAMVLFQWNDVAAGVQSAGHYRVVTDRAVYVAGEEIRFRVFNLNSPGIREQGWSTVYYLELISPRGNSLDRTKWPLDGRGASGMLPIPRDLPSGTYYLKGYTKWMRNIGPSGFQYLSLEIINPYRRDLLPVDTLSPSVTTLRPGEACGETTLPVMTLHREGLAGSEPYSLELRTGGSLLLDGAVSVSRKGAMGGQWESSGISDSGPPGRDGAFLPETNGISLTGSVSQDRTGDPVPFAVVYLSSLGTWNEFYATYTDEEGRFYFALTGGEGEREYFISSGLQGRTDLTLQLDQDFSAVPVTLPSFPLQTVETDAGLIRELAINAQIREQYRTDSTEQARESDGSHAWFYGHPDVVVRFSDFIQLPELEEYFREVIPQVTLRKSGGRLSFRVNGDHPDLQYFSPLVMVDGVAVFDVASIMEISPRLVDRVEMVTAPYIRGYVTFGGIVHLITRNGNMGYMDLPASGLLLSYQKYAVEAGHETPVEPVGAGMPDLRNTLYWNPSVILEPGIAKTLHFQAPATAGEYEIRLVGYGPGGQCYKERLVFRVE